MTPIRAPESLKEQLRAAAKSSVAQAPASSGWIGLEAPSFSEAALLALLFLAPWAFRTPIGGPATTLLETCALALFAAWLIKGLDRGRWESPAAIGISLLPLFALAAWALGRFVLSPFKIAALPELAPALAVGILYAAALLEMGGARPAARLSLWTAAAVFPALAGRHESAAAFAAAALPVILAAHLDPETPGWRRFLADVSAFTCAWMAGRSGSTTGLTAFTLSASLFALTNITILRGPAARRAAGIALACACFAAIRGRGLHPLDAALEPLSSVGTTGTILLAWTACAAAFCGWRAAWNLRQRGVLAEAGYASAFCAAFCAWALSRIAGLTPASGPGAWLAWAAAGTAAGMAALARPGGASNAFALPLGQSARRWLQAPVLALFAGLAAWPGLWFVSDLRYERALTAWSQERLNDALADVGRVWPGSASYAPALSLRGRILMDSGKPREALDAYARLDQIAPEFPEIHARRAEAYIALQDWQAAARERERQDRLTPLDPANLIAWAESAREAGDLSQARRAALRARALAPDFFLNQSASIQKIVQKKRAKPSLFSRRPRRAGGS